MNCATGYLERALGGPFRWDAESVARVAVYAFAGSPAGWEYLSRRGYRHPRRS
ncbi:MAG: hypothetical protein V3S03_08525 [Vicinamibacteria bacterium]